MTDFVDEVETEELREMVQELLDVDEGLYSGEISFLESMDSEWEDNFTVRQARWIRTIHERVIG